MAAKGRNTFSAKQTSTTRSFFKPQEDELQRSFDTSASRGIAHDYLKCLTLLRGRLIDWPKQWKAACLPRSVADFVTGLEGNPQFPACSGHVPTSYHAIAACVVLILFGKNLVLPEGIELSTSPLPRECSTTELRQPD